MRYYLITVGDKYVASPYALLMTAIKQVYLLILTLMRFLVDGIEKLTVKPILLKLIGSKGD